MVACRGGAHEAAVAAVAVVAAEGAGSRRRMGVSKRHMGRPRCG